MLAVVLTGPRTTELVSVDEPELVPGSLIIDVEFCGIGGSDLEAWETGTVPHPGWFGHEWSGRVTSVGPDVLDHFEGERVVGAVGPSCGTCPPCQAGFEAYCRTALAQIVGADPLASAHGAFSERIRADHRRVLRVPDGVDDRRAALTEPAAVAIHAIDLATPRLGDHVVVVGAGTIGLLVAELSRLSGAAHVVAVDPDAGRRELACDLGADAAFDDFSEEHATWRAHHGHGLGADIAYVCVESDAAVGAALSVVRPGGTVIGVGVGDTLGGFASRGSITSEVTLRSSLGYTRNDARRALDLMAADRLRVQRVIHDGDIELARLPSTFETIVSSRPPEPKILVGISR